MDPRSYRIVASLTLALLAVATALPAGAQKGKDEKEPALQANRPPLAVLPFEKSEDYGNWYWNANVGKSLGAMMTTELKTMGFRVVNRRRIGEILKEQDLGDSGRVNKKTAPAVGKVIGAPFMIMGTVSEFGKKSTGGGLGNVIPGIGVRVKQDTMRVKIDIELVDAETSEVIDAKTGTGSESNIGFSLTYDWFKNIDFNQDEWWSSQLGKAARKAVQDACKRLVAKYNQLPEWTKDFDDGESEAITASIVSAASPAALIIDKGSADGVKVGDRFEILKEDQVVKNEKGEVVFRKTTKVGEAEVAEVQEHGAMLKLVGQAEGGNPKEGFVAKRIAKKK
jgi:curli biogenesis system outer membrane secretion channel CsgG